MHYTAYLKILVSRMSENKIRTRAAVLYGPRDIRFEELEIPRTKHGHVLIRVKATSICPTDIRKYLGLVKIPVPVILGHEGAGIVEEVSGDTQNLSEGDRVWIRPIVFWCGKCKHCLRGEVNLCNELVALGFSGGSIEKCIELQKSGTIGLFSQYTLVPSHAVVKLPDNISLEEAPIIDPLSCVLKCMEDVKLRHYDEVIVIGCGPVGLLHVQVAKIMGALKIIAIEPLEERRKMALIFGADYVIDPTTEDPVARVKELTDRGADVVIVSVGGGAQAQCVEYAMSMAAKGGRINIFAGTYPKKEIRIDPNMIHYNELVLTGTFGYQFRHNYQAIKLLQEKKLNVSSLISPVYSFEELREAFEAYGKPHTLKIGVRMDY